MRLTFIRFYTLGWNVEMIAGAAPTDPEKAFLPTVVLCWKSSIENVERGLTIRPCWWHFFLGLDVYKLKEMDDDQ